MEELKIGSFKKINTIETSIKINQKRKKKVEKNNKIKNVRRASPIDPIDIRRIIRKYYEQLCANNFNNIDEVDKFLKKCYFQNGYKKKSIT